MPSASREYGNLGGSFSEVEQKTYRIVHIDSNKAQYKGIALDTLLALCEVQQALQGGLSEECIDHVASAIMKFCEMKHGSIRHHGV